MRRIALILGTLVLLAAAVALIGWPTGPEPEIQLDRIQMPAGFEISLYNDAVPNARSMVRTDGGTLFVGTREAGAVYAVVDADGDHRADRVYTIVEGYTMPNGVAFRDGALYVAEIGRIVRFDDIEARLGDPPAPVVVYDGLPEETWHGWRYIAFGPDDRLYVSVGAPCNVCERDAPFATILRMNPDGTDVETVARGVRNSVGFDWHPETGDLWFTDNGRDMLGDDRPPCELNHAPAPGFHFGFPYVHGADLLDPEYGEGHAPSAYRAPAQNLGPHVAPLGMAFYTGDQFPDTYRQQVFIAEHGSWNRSEKIGYRVTLVTLSDDSTATGYRPFAEGWLQGEDVWGRPVDLELLPDGSLLVSDDLAGAIYRIAYPGG